MGASGIGKAIGRCASYISIDRGVMAREFGQNKAHWMSNQVERVPTLRVSVENLFFLPYLVVIR